MNWKHFLGWSALWFALGPVLALPFGGHPIDGLVGAAIFYVFPFGGIWCCAAMAGMLD